MNTDKISDKCKIEFVNGSSIEIPASEEDSVEMMGWTIVSVGDGIFYSEYGGEILRMNLVD